MRRFQLRIAAFLGVVALSYMALLASVIYLNRRALDECRLARDVDAVIAGDSHPMWSIDDSKVPGLRNVALNGEGYRYTYLKLKHLLAIEQGIKKVYVGVGYHNFSGYFDDYIHGDAFKFFAHRYLPILTGADYMQVAAEHPWGVFEFSKYLLTQGAIPGLRQECLLYGGFPADKQTKVFDPASMRRRIQSQFYKDGQVIGQSSSNVIYLQKVVDLCRTHGVQMAILNTPVHEAYVRNVPEKYHRMLVDFVEANHLEYYDFRDLRLPDSCFLPDGDHLNYEGAARATQAFANYHHAHR